MNNIKLSINYAKSKGFISDACIIGFIVNAQLGFGMCYGNIYGDMRDKYIDGTFISFMPIGTDNRRGYNIVKTINGSFVIINEDINYNPATERGFNTIKKQFVR